jgi:hypothetical protein
MISVDLLRQFVSLRSLGHHVGGAKYMDKRGLCWGSVQSRYGVGLLHVVEEKRYRCGPGQERVIMLQFGVPVWCSSGGRRESLGYGPCTRNVKGASPDLSKSSVDVKLDSKQRHDR